MPSFFRINVSLNGTFYFRADNEFISSINVGRMVKDFRTRFPESEGFKVTLTHWEASGMGVEVK
jgi:hypothetical protein